MPAVSIDQLRTKVQATHEPQFMLPARFETVSFDSFEIDPDNPAQMEIIEQVGNVLDEAARPLRFWQKRDSDVPRGIYMSGPPGIGKTHLLAAAFLQGPEPKLFATFDEFLAAAGTLGMADLSDFLATRQLVCIDEVDLDDPANIMLLNTLLQAMLAGQPAIIATANARPGSMSGGRYYDDPFTRELSEIAESFIIIELDGKDWRESAAERPSQIGGGEHRVVSFTWPELMTFLYETHPMYDAAWLLEIDVIQIDGFQPLQDSDQAIRFVRFIDRVYDRAVRLRTTGHPLAPGEILAPIRDERRFHLHFIRCQSRLKELIRPGRERMGEVADGTS